MRCRQFVSGSGIDYQLIELKKSRVTLFSEQCYLYFFDFNTLEWFAAVIYGRTGSAGPNGVSSSSPSRLFHLSQPFDVPFPLRAQHAAQPLQTGDDLRRPLRHFVVAQGAVLRLETGMEQDRILSGANLLAAIDFRRNELLQLRQS